MNQATDGQSGTRREFEAIVVPFGSGCWGCEAQIRLSSGWPHAEPPRIAVWPGVVRFGRDLLAIPWGARACFGTSDLELALGDFGAALEIAPRYAEVYLERGAVHCQQGDLEAGIADFERCLEVSEAGWLHRIRAENLLERARREMKER